MKLKWILISVLLILLVAYVSGAPTTKSYNADTKTISLKSGQTTTTIQQISFTPSISSAEEVFKITTPLNVELKSFYNIRSSVSSGSSGMTGYEVYELVGGKWVTATTIHSGTYKFVYHKKAEVGHTSVQLIPSFSGVECPEFTWWDTDWLKRQTGTITNPSGSAGYEIKLDVTYDGDMQADFDDLRFVADDDTTELHYWIESKVDSTSAVVWIEAPASDTTFYMYYDNDAVSTTSSGEATFDFFDSFSGDAYNETDWTRNAGTATVSGGILAVTAGGSSWQGVYTDVSYGNNHATRARQKGATHASGNVASGFSNSINGGGGTHTADWYQAYTTTYVNYHYAKNNDGGSQSAAKSSDGTTYHTYDIIRNTTTSNLYKRDDSLEDTRTSSITAQSIPCVIQAYYSTSSIYTDWFLVRDYVYPEPTGSFGAEQPQVVAAFSANATTGCAPIYIGFTDSSTGSPTSWDWDFGDGTAHSSDQNPVHEYTTYGTFTVVLIASTAYMSDSETKTDYITLGQAPTTGF